MSSLVMEVAPLIGNVGVHGSNLLSCLLPTSRPSTAARHSALGDPQCALSGSETSRVRDLGAIRARSERGDAHVESNRRTACGQRHGRQFHTKTSKPSAGFPFECERLDERVDR